MFMPRRLLVVLVLAVATPPPVEAQLSLGLAGGVSLPEGDLADGVRPGWHALGTIALSSLMQPLGLRLDVAYSRFAFDADAAPAFSDDHQTTSSVTLNLTYRLPMTNSPTSPYIILGAGGYRSDCSQCEANTDFGWNAGAGTKLILLGLRTFLEARYHRTGASHYFPVTFGLMF
jgi:hypothetical protein